MVNEDLLHGMEFTICTCEPFNGRDLLILYRNGKRTAKTLTNLAELYRDQYKYEQAELLFTRALAIQEHTLSTKHPDFARTVHSFARLYERLGVLQTASALYQRALTIRQEVYGPQHVHVVLALLAEEVE